MTQKENPQWDDAEPTPPEHGLSAFYQSLSLRQKIIAGFTMPVVLMMCLSALAYKSTQALVETGSWVNHTNKVIAKGHELEKLVLAMETGERGFLITGKERSLEPFKQAHELWQLEIVATKNLVSDNPPQVKRLDIIDASVQRWLKTVVTPVIMERRVVKGVTISPGIFDSELDSRNLKEIEEGLTKFISVEQELIETRTADARAAIQNSLYVTIFGTLVVILFAASAGFYLMKHLVQALTELVRGTKRVARGNFDRQIRVAGSDEISQLAIAFNNMSGKIKTSIEAITQSNELLERQKGQLNQQKNEILIANADLRDKETELKKKAEDLVLSNQYKSEFLATMSHEIRTPMNGVLGMLGLLMKSDLDDNQMHKASVAEASAQSLLVIINDILDYSKIDSGKMELEDIEFDLRSLIEEVCQSMALRAQDKGLELVVDILGVKQQFVRGDPGRIRQIITNLVGNSLKFTEKGEIVIRAQLEESTDGNLSLSCDVEDTGIGIPESKRDRLFEDFAQADASTTRKYGGTGLGLSIVKRLCELMHGNVSVASTEGQGSCFSFALKLRASEHAVSRLPRVDVSSLSILIVDDNATNREVLRGQLEVWGARVTEASSAAQALQLCRTQSEEQGLSAAPGAPFDVGLLDMQMPEMNGADLGRELKSTPEFKNMKLVIMSSITSRGDAQYFSKLGFQGYFPKPATASDLFAALSVLADDGKLLQQAKPLITQHYVNGLSDTDEDGIPDWPENARILLVEDNKINQQVALNLLEDINLTADIAADGVEALRCLKEASDGKPYTLVLMDCQMPEMDGYEATREIRAGRAGGANSRVPILAMTANAMGGDREKCLEAGMSDYISKPIDPDRLDKLIMKWLLAPEIET